jgi:hypothetical protein
LTDSRIFLKLSDLVMLLVPPIDPHELVLAIGLCCSPGRQSAEPVRRMPLDTHQVIS